MTKERLPAHLRFMMRRDIPEILAIEEDAFEFGWSEKEFIRCLRQRNCIGMVAECDGQVAGYMIYELQKTRIHVLNFAVAKNYRRTGVGSKMVAKLASKLWPNRRTNILLEVRETNLAAQLFFRSCGFRATRVLYGHWDDTPEDAYQMQYLYRPKCSDETELCHL